MYRNLKFLHMTDFFSTDTVLDKYEVCDDDDDDDDNDDNDDGLRQELRALRHAGNHLL